MADASNVAKSKRRKEIEEGIIANQYTLENWFVKIYPAYAIDLVKFSFVMKGHNGEGFDIYVSMDKMDLWCDDILSFRMQKIIEAEKAAGEKYPKTYKYITGTDGSKSVGFAPSTVKGAFAVINASVVKDGKMVFANIPVDYDWLRIMAKWFRRTSEKWFSDMAALLLDSARASRPSADDVEQPTQTETTTPPQTTPQNTQTTQTTQKKYVEERLKVSNLTESTNNPGTYIAAAETKDEEHRKVNLIFRRENIEKMGTSKWEEFRSMINAKGSLSVNARYEVDGNKYYFVELVNNKAA